MLFGMPSSSVPSWARPKASARTGLFGRKKGWCLWSEHPGWEESRQRQKGLKKAFETALTAWKQWDQSVCWQQSWAHWKGWRHERTLDRLDAIHVLSCYALCYLQCLAACTTAKTKDAQTQLSALSRETVRLKIGSRDSVQSHPMSRTHCLRRMSRKIGLHKAINLRNAQHPGASDYIDLYSAYI